MYVCIHVCNCTYNVYVLFYSRQREQQLVAAHQVELDSLSAQNQKQLKGFLDDFNTAKDMLNAEIQSLNEQ